VRVEDLRALWRVRMRDANSVGARKGGGSAGAPSCVRRCIPPGTAASISAVASLSPTACVPLVVVWVMLERSVSGELGIATGEEPRLGVGPLPGAQAVGRKPWCRDCRVHAVLSSGLWMEG
jgi:hypothetical protein